MAHDNIRMFDGPGAVPGNEFIPDAITQGGCVPETQQQTNVLATVVMSEPELTISGFQNEIDAGFLNDQRSVFLRVARLFSTQPPAGLFFAEEADVERRIFSNGLRLGAAQEAEAENYREHTQSHSDAAPQYDEMQ